ncbi:FAD binding domain-containing protein [Mycolicibacterium komossense]|uniref:FAD-dependent monooxygenase n=1 Tax=Mycolicibacterium komossense TaxID=1779 RepID=A0ABT3CID3_9MYCO|nr:FAD-dependent monooxygenase [Mycolicibacterium komossense]MCV7229225.1 FAD-dependent monooxygenase [Mycolicibacterium komossense]
MTKALVIGGSVGGLAAAHELRTIGADVAVYERSVDRTQPRGAGIVMQPEVEELLARLGISVPSVSVELQERQQLHHDGRTTRYRAPQWMTAWDTLFHAFRTPLSDACYRLDSSLQQVVVDSDHVTATFADGSSARGDFLVGADGVGSTTRTLLGIPGYITYSGYVAFRGLEPESGLPDELRELLAERFTLFGVPGMQMLCYLVPGADGQLDRGARRVNWVWYVNTPASAVATLLTGTSGRQFENFLPPGELTAENSSALVDLAREALPPQFGALVQHSTVFLQPVFDRAPAAMVAGRAALIGDAAGTVRPHTASGTSKALGDAAALAHALARWSPGDDLPVRLLEHFEHQRLSHLIGVARSGVRMAAQSRLGNTGPDFLTRLALPAGRS